MKIAIIGAGFSGTNIYQLLKQDSHDVTVFEKSRGAGGRCSTRYVDDKLIDHGTPFFKTSSEAFEEFINLKVDENILMKKDSHYYPSNGMNKICSSLLDDNDFKKNTKIISCDFENAKWSLKDENGTAYESFDKLIITIPATQVLEMDINLPTQISNKLQDVKYDSTASLMIYSYTLQNISNPILLKDSSFSKIVDNSSKYDYKSFSSYVLHLDRDLTNKQEFKNKDEVKEFMLKKVHDVSGISLEEDFHILPHFWKYAFVSQSLEDEYLYDENCSLGFCGDYFDGQDLEGAFLSSKRLYENVFR